MGRAGQLLASFFSLSPVTDPEGFVTVNSAQFLPISKVATWFEYSDGTFSELLQASLSNFEVKSWLPGESIYRENK